MAFHILSPFTSRLALRDDLRGVAAALPFPLPLVAGWSAVSSIALTASSSIPRQFVRPRHLETQRRERKFQTRYLDRRVRLHFLGMRHRNARCEQTGVIKQDTFGLTLL